MARRATESDVARPSGLSDADIRAAASEILAGESGKSGYQRLAPFLGPAFIAAVAYVDPGNFATNIQGGAEYGYLLVWVIVASNLMAMLIQIAFGQARHRHRQEPGRGLPGAVSRARRLGHVGASPRCVAMATDLAEFLGAALGFNLLFGIPLFPAAMLTGDRDLPDPRPAALRLPAARGGDHGDGRRYRGLLPASRRCIGNPDWGAIAHDAVTPQFDGTESVLLAVGILGATVMPHVIFLHSALTQDRIVTRDTGAAATAVPVRDRRCRDRDGDCRDGQRRDADHGRLDLPRAGADRHRVDRRGAPDAGAAARVGARASIFAHLAAGVGPVLVDGRHDGRAGDHAGLPAAHIPIWLRRGVTMLPGADRDRDRARPDPDAGHQPGGALVRYPVRADSAGDVHARKRDLMGTLVNRRFTTILASLVAAIIVGLNVFLLYETLIA